MTRRAATWRTSLAAALLIAITAVPVVPAAGSGTRGAEAEATLSPFGPCPDLPDLECATLTVPIDHDRPKGATIDVAVSRLPALDPSRRIGVLLVNPGGPGGSGLSLPLSLRERASPLGRGAEVFQRYDVVGFDPRGVGASAPVECSDLSALDHADYSPDDQGEASALVDVVRSFGRACEEKSGGLLEHVSTADTVRDLDLLRDALGERKVSFLGFSYGTYMGAVYADLFPRRLRRLVLDAPLPPKDTRGAPLLADQAKSISAGFDAFAQACAVAGRCPVAGDMRTLLGDALARLEETPVVVNGIEYTASQAVTVTAYLLGAGEGLYARLAATLDQLRQGNGALLAESWALLIRSEPNYSEAIVAIGCLDLSWPTGTAGIRRLLAQLRRSSTLFGESFLREALPCATWPIASRPHRFRGAKGLPSALVIGTTGDPLIPLAYARQTAREIPNAVLLTVTGTGHRAFGRSPCSTDATATYLVEGTLPAPATEC